MHYYFIHRIFVLFILISLSFFCSTYANYDHSSTTLSCDQDRPNTSTSIRTNGTCNITERQNGTKERITRRHFQPCDSSKKDCSDHYHTTGCTYSGGWYHVATHECWPTYTCLTSGISTANAHIISPYELPDVGGVYPLAQNYYYTIVPTGSGGTSAGCEYACDGGYIRDASTVFCRLPVCIPTPGIASVVIGGLHYIANGDFVTPSDNPANLQLNQDWQIAINWSASGDDKSTINKPNSNNGCEFTCNDGFIKATDAGTTSCRRAFCLPGVGMGISTNDTPPANAYPLSANELPPSGMLTMDYVTTINWAASGDSKASITRPSSTKWCEYTCNDGYIKANDSGLISCRRARCLPNASIQVSTTDTAPPHASPLSADELPWSGMLTMDYTTTLVDPITRPNSTKGCEYTCDNGYKLVTESGITKCIPIVCIIDPAKWQKAPTSTLCDGDDLHANMSWHVDLPFTYVGYVGTTPSCTGPTKCEWYCPSTTPYYCSLTNTCLTRAADCCPTGQTLCPNTGKCAADCTTCGTFAPSELKANVDQPYIKCDPIDLQKTHFRYQITQGTNVIYTSNAFPTGTEVKHPNTFATLGSYTVTCLYGTLSEANDSSKINSLIKKDTCAKTMVVKAENTATQWCSNIYAYRGSTLSNEMTSADAFNGSFRCGSRINLGTIEAPYKLKIGTSGTASSQTLTNDAGFLALFPEFGFGISTQSNPYQFTTINTPVECAVKVWDWYSTNSLCQATACVGSNCTAPQTFVVSPSSESVCTPDLKSSYDIGCNPLDTANYPWCVKWLYDWFKTCTIADQTACPPIKRIMNIKKNGIPDTSEITCKITKPAWAINFVKECSMLLPSGNIPVTIFWGDDDSYQTTRYSLQQDTVSPGAKLEYFVKSGTGTTLVTAEYWKNKPVTATITCNDLPGSSDWSECACAQALDGDTGNLWSFGVPSVTGWPDMMTYNRTIASSYGPSTAVRVQDTAWLKSPDIIVNIAVDTTAPQVIPTMTGTTVTLTVTDTGGSGLWRPGKAGNTLPAGMSQDNAVLYRVGPIWNKATLQFIDNCVPDNNGNYYKYSETGSAATGQTVTIPSVDASKIIAYCVQDNAGNVTRWVYPSTPVACFSASNMSTVPKLSTTNNYIAPLIARITSATPQYGYGMSEDTNTANCFRGIISSNISRLVSSQYNSTLLNNTNNPINWSDAAKIKTNPTIANTNGYYYYTTNNGTNNTTLTINSSPAGRGTKTVVAEGANIHITNNINYLDEGDSTKILILIAKKNPTTGTGWNIYVDPSVTNIDAILIADGSLLNGSATATPSNITSLDWLTSGETNLISNRLTINGRLYSMNTRWGSLTGSGTILSAIAPWAGKYFNPANSQLSTPATVNLAAEQDLERFRYINDDGAAQCTLHINYKTIPVNQLPAVLIRPYNFSGGNCGF